MPDERTGQLNLGELIDKLKECEITPDHSGLCFDFMGLEPTGEICSWRGIFSQLAIVCGTTWDFPHKMSVPDFIKILEDAIGKTYEGWKGGGCFAQRDTPVWVVIDPSQSGETVITDVYDNGYEVILYTHNITKDGGY